MTASKLDQLINLTLAIIAFIGAMVVMSGIYMLDTKDITECAGVLFCGLTLIAPGIVRAYESR